MRRAVAVSVIPAMMLIATLTVVLASERGTATSAQAGGNSKKSVWDGVYTPVQARQGKDSFDTYCSSCHAADLSGGEGPALKGDVFLGHWLEDSLNVLFNYMEKMPPGNRDKPAKDVYLDILAHILDVNTFPAGTEVLKANLLGDILVTGKDGPGEVPNFALVQVVGCLTQGSDGAWMLSNAGEPTRTRNPEKPTAAELNAAAAKPLGTRTFLLLDPSSFNAAFQLSSHRGEKLEGKGFLIRNPTDERLNVTWLEKLASSCP